jgi:hypothetical protein
MPECLEGGRIGNDIPIVSTEVVRIYDRMSTFGSDIVDNVSQASQVGCVWLAGHLAGNESFHEERHSEYIETIANESLVQHVR